MTTPDRSSDPELPAAVVEAAVDAREQGPSFPIVGVGASAGGLEAFTQLLTALPPDAGMAFVLVQHLAPSHPSALAEILSRATKMPVTEVLGESTVEVDHVYVIPPDRSMVIARGRLQLLQREGRGIHRPIDQFFRALAADRRHRAIGVVLSGTASDGTLGLEAIKAEGGITLAQDATAQHEGMPRSAVASGCVDFVLSPDAIAREIVRIGQHPYGVPEAVASGTHDEPNLAQILQVVHGATGVDFTHYKFNTLYRRITRRMIFCKVQGLDEYVALLRRTPEEVEALYQDILISVTSFFRDPGAFESLKRTVFPRLLQARADPVRLWTLGCSTGQEAYSLAIAFAEVAAAADSTAALQLFATDINAAAIEKARAGVYPKDIAEDVSPERLRRFFVEVDGSYRISKAIRDACVFSRHNVLADPPFSRMDLISCRNLLIYMEPVLQQRIMPVLHYALKPAGCLWLGSSETIGAYRDLFETEDQKHKIFAKKAGSDAGPGQFPVQHGGEARSAFVPIAARPRDAADLPREADRLLLHRFAPPGVVVSPALDILQYRGDTGPYLAPAPGKASLNLLKMLREGLLVAVRAAVLRAGESGAPVRQEGIRVKSTDGNRAVAIEVIPLEVHDRAKDKGFLVLFDEAGAANAQARSLREPAAAIDADTDSSRLEQELAATRAYLQSVIEQQEIANEELQSANEEVQSANEELQSTNEELETSKEEIQSSNEELATVNDELNNRNADLHRINDDLVNLMGSGQMAVVMLGSDLRVRRFTPLAEKLFNLIPADVGRRLVDIKLNFVDLPDVEALLHEVLHTVAPQEHDVRDKRGRWYSLRVRPYRTSDERIDGLVMVLVDVDLAKRAHAFTESIVATVREPLLVLDKDLRVQLASRAFYEAFTATPSDTVGRTLLELGGGRWNAPDLLRRLQDVLTLDSELSDFEVEHDLHPVGKRTMVLNARRLLQGEESTASILLAIEDVTERRRAERALQASEVRFRRLFEAAKDGILMLDAASHKITHVNPFLTDLLDYPAEHFLGKELWEIGVLGDQRASTAALQQLHEHGSIRYEDLPLEGRDGRVHPVELIASEYTEGAEVVIQCTIRDIADRHRLETQLRAQATELSDLHRRKDEFLAMLSHELRSPLAPIANAVQLLGAQQGNENPIQQKARHIIERQMAQLQLLVNELLEVSRITTGKMKLHSAPVLVSDVVTAALETVGPLMEQYRHEVVLSQAPEPIWLHADSARLEQVLVNLLGNAAKFTNKGGRIWLTVRREDDRCVLSVRDTGIGIPPSELPSVFDLMTQGERSLDRSGGGLGIGLALVKRLTEKHGGTVEVESTVGQGSEFVVRLPVGPPAAPLSPSPARPTASRRLKMLVVDDNVDAVTSLAMLLSASGHSVRTAQDGLAAIEVALEFHPDVVMLDIGLPELDGFEVARRLRLEPALEHVVLIALTGYGREQDRQATQHAGFDHHLVKPAEFRRLQEILASVEPPAPRG
ncbi:MAG TPA: chemotaxis protein CheB [Planctomycetota bacterium]|nr:chemotaxis protein CheB [Planctomycetota bacterium]